MKREKIYIFEKVEERSTQKSNDPIPGDWASCDTIPDAYYKQKVIYCVFFGDSGRLRFVTREYAFLIQIIKFLYKEDIAFEVPPTIKSKGKMFRKMQPFQVSELANNDRVFIFSKAGQDLSVPSENTLDGNFSYRIQFGCKRHISRFQVNDIKSIYQILEHIPVQYWCFDVPPNLKQNGHYTGIEYWELFPSYREK